MKNRISKIYIAAVTLLVLANTRFAVAGVTTTGTSDPVLFENPISGIKDIYSLIYAILDFIAKAGSIVVIVMIIYSGFLFVKAQGNESEISKAKETFFWSVIGAIILLGAKALALVVCNTANGLGAGVSCSLMR